MVAISHPKTLRQALDILATGEHILFAGGTDLMVRQRTRPNIPTEFSRNIVFTDHIGELSQIVPTSEGVRIGAAVTMDKAISNPLVPELLKQSLLKLAAPALRNRATIAGNICNASPAADTLPILYLLNAKVVLERLGNVRCLAIEDFIQGPGKTALQSDEMLTQIEIPLTDLPLTYYHKVGTRAANALTKIAFIGAAKVTQGVVTDWRVAFGAVAPTIVRNQALEAEVVGKSVADVTDAAFMDKLVLSYAELIKPIDDQRSTAIYRKTCALNLLKRFLTNLSSSD